VDTDVAEKPASSTFSVQMLNLNPKKGAFVLPRNLQYPPTRLLTYGGLLEDPQNLQLLKKFPAFDGTPRFFIVFTRAFHWSLS
jgi:hypothetical protein